MANNSALQIQATFADALSRLDGQQLVVIMDDYKAMATVAAIHHDRKAVTWLESRVAIITDAYGAYVLQAPLPF